MHEAGSFQSITLTLAMGLWPWTQWKRIGPVWAVALRLYGGAGKSVWALQDQYMTAVECCSALQHLPGLMQFVFVNDGWRGGENVTKTALYLMQMSWKGVCVCGGGTNENDQFSTWCDETLVHYFPICVSSWLADKSKGNNSNRITQLNFIVYFCSWRGMTGSLPTLDQPLCDWLLRGTGWVKLGCLFLLFTCDTINAYCRDCDPLDPLSRAFVLVALFP